jgi:hypothetical protein
MLESKSQPQAPLQVSKWVKLPLLVDVHEMEDLLLRHVPPFKMYDVQRVTQADGGIVDPSFFLEGYSRYIACLKEGKTPTAPEFRSLFSLAWSVHEEALVSIHVEETAKRRLLKVILPSVQTQLNQIRYSPGEKVFLTQVFGPDTLYWGIQIGFPHLYLDPKTFEATHTRDFPNMALFLAIQKWVRANTVPTPFIVGEVKVNSPIRLGKSCFSWIHTHPQLAPQGIRIDGRV